MDEYSKELELLRILIAQTPSLITLVISMVVVILRWKRHPKVSLVLTVGLLFLFFHILLFATQVLWLPEFVVGRKIFVASESLQNFFAVMSFIYSAGIAFSLGMFLISIFMQRQTKTPQIS